MSGLNWPRNSIDVIGDWIAYAALRARSLGLRASEAEREFGHSLQGYPRNHNYRIADGRVVPSLRLYRRLRRVLPLYPEPLERLLDIGCCRGCFVLEAGGRAGCRKAVGIDVYEPFVETAKQAAQMLQVSNCEFHFATLDEVAHDPAVFGGPFQTVLLLNTYHYLFWGSQLSPAAYLDHQPILSRLAAVTSDRIIVTARLEIDRLPRPLRKEARAREKAGAYTTARFLAAARRLFDVRQAGSIGKDALLVMSKRRA